jgi:hypothetical protein
LGDGRFTAAAHDETPGATLQAGLGTTWLGWAYGMRQPLAAVGAAQISGEVGWMAAKQVAHPSIGERQAQGRQAHDRTPASSHAGWCPAADRPDPVGLLEEQDITREPDLVPVRHGRMMVSPFGTWPPSMGCPQMRSCR